MRISESMKNMVIKEWLKGNHRDRIAVQTGLSSGTVSNIIREWGDRLGNYEVEEMREFSVMCRKADITPSQCVQASELSNYKERWVLRRGSSIFYKAILFVMGRIRSK